MHLASEEARVGGPSRATLRALVPVADEVRHGDDDHMRLEEEGRPDEERRLVVEQVLPPVARDDLRRDDGDEEPWRLGLESFDERHERAHDAAVRRWEDLEFVADVPAIPVVEQPRRVLGVHLDVHGAHVLVPCGGVEERRGGRLVDARHRDDDRVRVREDGAAPAEGDVDREAPVVGVDGLERDDEQRNEERDDPAALGELGDNLDDGDDAGGDSAHTVERGAPAPSRRARAPPMHDHACLREGEADEDADGVERHERGGVALEHPDDDAGDEREHHDAVAEGEAVTAGGELVGQVLVAREDAGQAREVGEGGVGRQHEDGEGRELERVVPDAVAEDGVAQAREDGLVHGGHRAQVLREVAGAEEEGGEDRDHPGERDGGVALGRRLEGLDAIGDGLGAGHRGAALGEAAHEQEDEREAGDAADRVRRTRGARIHVERDVGDEGCGAVRDLPDAERDEGDHHRDEAVGGDAEGGTRLADAAQVDDHKQRHRGERDGDRVGDERGVGAGDRRNATGDRHGNGEDVVGEERGRGDEARSLAEVFAGDGVRAAAAGIGVHGLLVAQADEHEQRDDDGRDREDVAQGRHAEGAAEDEEGLVGGVGDRGDGVTREDREGGLLVELLVVEAFAGERGADEEALGDRERGHAMRRRRYPVRLAGRYRVLMKTYVSSRDLHRGRDRPCAVRRARIPE